MCVCVVESNLMRGWFQPTRSCSLVLCFLSLFRSFVPAAPSFSPHPLFSSPFLEVSWLKGKNLSIWLWAGCFLFKTSYIKNSMECDDRCKYQEKVRRGVEDVVGLGRNQAWDIWLWNAPVLFTGELLEWNAQAHVCRKTWDSQTWGSWLIDGLEMVVFFRL